MFLTGTPIATASTKTCQLNSNNSIEFFIIYVLSQQLQGQLQTQHSVDTGNYIMDKHNIKSQITGKHWMKIH
jgi:hypothetical protein